MVEESDITDSLGEVEDPEMKMSVTELGLIYDIRIEDRDEGAVSYTHLTLPTICSV